MSERMHCHEELIQDLQTGRDSNGFIKYELMLKWHRDKYSTSKHLLTVYYIARNLGAKVITEIGAGRSSFVLALAAYRNGGRFITCDRYDYRELFSEQEKKFIIYIHGWSEKFFEHQSVQYGIDFIFMDHLSSKRNYWTHGRDIKSCYKEIKKAFKLLKQNGIIAIHDVCDKKYDVGKGLEMFKEKYHDQCEVLSLPYCYGLGLIRKTVKSNYGKLELKYAKKFDSNS